MKFLPLSKPNCTIEISDHFVRVTLPNRPSTLQLLWFGLWLFMWGNVTYTLIELIVVFIRAIEAGKNSVPPVHLGGVFTFFSIAFLIFFISFLGMGAFAIHRFIWFILGKEIIEATPQTLTLTRHALRWKKVKNYSSEKLNRLRTNTQRLSVFLPGKKTKRFFGGAGMIAFDYDGKTITAGYMLNQTDAEQIISTIQEVFSKANTQALLTPTTEH
jgi:hypothetical protein